ncbi:MAG: hypothetical protein OWU33_07720 [Firmicutes bacterium]|nr:hypothetical protein [Bacillota bacterium]
MGKVPAQALPREQSLRRASLVKHGLTAMTFLSFIGFFALAWEHRVGVTAHAVPSRPTPQGFFGHLGQSGSPVSTPTVSQTTTTPVTTTNVS